jgi:hypothetical protein
MILGFHRGCTCGWLAADWVECWVEVYVGFTHLTSRSSLFTTRQAPPAAVARCSPVHPRSNSIIAPLTGGPSRCCSRAHRRGCA